MSRLDSPAAQEFRQAVRILLADLFGGFLRRLPTLLNEDGRRASRPAEQQANLELARSIQGATQKWVDIFTQRIDAHLIGGATEIGKPGAGSLNEIVDSIPMANIELRAEEMHAAVISELDKYMEHVRRALYVPVFSRALAPAGICRALQDTAELMGCSSLQRHTLFEKFDQLVVSDLGRLYRALISILIEIGERAEQAAAQAAAAQAASAQAAAAQAAAAQAAAARAAATQAAARARQAIPPPVMPTVPPPTSFPLPPAEPVTPTPAARGRTAGGRPQIDTQTASMLRSYAEQAATEGYNDGSLASELLSLEQQKPVAGMNQGQDWAPLQRIELAGSFLNENIADPLVSSEMRPHHETVRFPLVKSALADATLFTALTHPLRSLVNELMLKSATSRVSGNVEARQMAEVLRQVLVQFDLAPDFVREAMLTAQPIEDGQIQKFFDMQRQQALQRRDAVIDEAKRQIVRKLELATFGRSVPQPAIKFLNAAWGPLLVKRLLKLGASDPLIEASLNMVDRLLDELDMVDADPSVPPSLQELKREFGKELQAEGLTAERITELLAGLDEAWRIRQAGGQFSL